MKPTPMADDRLPVVLVVLDGLGDRPIAELGGRTPAEAAHTPVLDELTVRGACGWHLPFGWGRAASSELAHWAMFGYSDVPFPGRAILEAAGAGLKIPAGVATTYAALRTSVPLGGRLRVVGRASASDADDVAALFDELKPLLKGHSLTMHPLERGEAILMLPGHEGANVTDSDPFFEHLHPWLQVQASSDRDVTLAASLNTVLREARAVLVSSSVNRTRAAAGRVPLDVLTTKWTGMCDMPLPSFVEQAGVAGGAVTSTRLYRGIARLLEMREEYLAPQANPATDVAARIESARRLVAGGARFVHVHSKATDEAGHTKQPRAKLDVLEALDGGLRALADLAESTIVAITGDHASPSTDGVLHTADPTPLLLVGPTVRPDRVRTFGELAVRDGWYGVVRAHELLPLLFEHANRPAFMGHRLTPRTTWALPDDPVPMPID